jgi:transposase
VLNKTYYEMAEHYGTAVIPTRVRAPKDKATVEGTVGIVAYCAEKKQSFRFELDTLCAGNGQGLR